MTPRKIALLALGLTACATVPYTKRHQINLVSAKQEMQMGNEAYAQVLKENKLSANAEYQRRIKAIGARIKEAANQPDFDWQFNVLQGDQVNAFCLPGGKVAFWEAIMPICGDDNGIAVVMGHEVAHALAHHGAERMSQGQFAALGGQLLSIGLDAKGATPAAKDAFLKGYGAGAQFGVMLPFSRSHESEADHIGLILMAKAGYDPRTAVDFWKKMSQTGGKKPPELLSTHPADATRIKHIEEWLPEANTFPTS